MQRNTRPDGLDLAGAQLSRSQSLISDRPSLSAISTVQSSPPSVSPAPSYIAASAASGIVTGEQQALSPAFAADQSADAVNDVVLVSAASLALINGFLDQLLYNFLSTARSTSLASLRPAVVEVLKPRLARDAIAGADDELKEFLGGGDDEELTAFHGGQEPRGDWDLEFVWKLTRLRCMVYTRLGDIEEDDEDEYLEREQLNESGGGPRRFTSHIGTVSPAAAIFLTSIIEFVGEQTLLIAGDAARNRILSRQGHQDSQETSPGRRVVEEGDTEKIALDRTFGRLWRTWRRRVRSPSHSVSRPISRDSFYRRSHSSLYAGTRSRHSSISTFDDSYEREDRRVRPNVAEVLHEDDPANIPLPMSDDDVNEIEVPGVASAEDDIDDRSQTPTATAKRRPQSMLIFPSRADLPTPISSDAETPPNCVSVGRVRSRSLPTPVQTPYASPTDEHLVDSTFATPLEAAIAVEEPEVPESSNDKQPETPSAPTRNIEEESVSAQVQPSQVPIAAITAGAAAGAVARRGARAAELECGEEVQTPRDASHPVNQAGHDMAEERVNIDEDEATAKTPMAANMNIPQITQHLVSELSTENDQRGSRTSEIYVYVKQPHHGRDPSLTTTEAGDDYDYRNDPLDHEGATQGAADPEDLALSENGDQAEHKEEPRAFVLSAPPLGRYPRSSEYPVKRQDVTSTVLTTPSPALSRTPGAENGVPPLTPLREMMEAAHDTSDEASRSSIGASQGRSRSSYGTGRETAKHDSLASQERAASSNSSHSQNKHSSVGSRYSELRNQVMLPQQQSSSERAGVQRVSPPPLTPREAVASRTHRSESIGSIDKRPITAGSTTSRVSRKQTLPLRTSIDGPGSANGENHRDTVGPDSFDNLVKSGQTIQYTLTPQAMREMEASDSPRWRIDHRTQTSELADFFKNTAPPDDERLKTGRPISSVKGVNGLRSHPIDPPPHSPTQPAITLRQKSTDLVEAASRPKRKILGMGVHAPRDPRLEKDSTRDFADFIRSTGPESPQQLPMAISSRPATAHTESAPKPAFATQTWDSRSAENTPKITRSHTISSTSTTSGPRRSGPRLEARPAALPHGNKSSDLIDFIREGPPLDPRDGGHRVPRAIAPFRTTTDSDEISALGAIGSGATIDKDALARISVASTQESSVPTVSVHSSSNSRTGLLDSTNQTSNRTSNNAVAAPWHRTQGDDTGPQRKHRRVRDPYAIDTDSDDEALERYSTPTPQREEESLIDFLRNVAPPTEAQTTPQPLLGAAAVQKKNSAPNIKDRIMRKSSVNAGSKGRQRSEPMVLPTRRSSSGAIYGNTQPPPRSVSPHLSQTGSRLDSYKPTQPTYAAHIDRVRGNKAVSQGQARSGRADAGGSSELAEFFKNSGPPPTSQTYAPSVTREETGFSRMFSRKKKPAAYV